MALLTGTAIERSISWISHGVYFEPFEGFIAKTFAVGHMSSSRS